MVPVMSLWAPILLSAVIVFVASSIIHMVLTYHRSDFAAVPREDEVMEALRKQNIPPGEYMVPRAPTMEAMRTTEFQEKVKKGPVLLMTVMPAGGLAAGMGPQLAQWFVFCVVVSVFAAYVTGRAVGPGAPYLTIFRFAGVTAFAGYTLAAWPATIWYRRKVSTSIKLTFDGLVYSLLTAGTFGWLWPN